MQLSPNQITALLIAISFAAGLNVYATVATLGLLARAGALTLPGELDVVANWWVIGISGVLFVIEFFADKIPAFDLIWNALQTFVRVPVGALLAYAATSQLSPTSQMLATMAGGGLAFVAHGAKTAVRVGVTPSPEPFSNIVLSLAEDAFTIFITWFATQHPYIAATIVAILLALMIVLIRWLMRGLRTVVGATMRRLHPA